MTFGKKRLHDVLKTLSRLVGDWGVRDGWRPLWLAVAPFVAAYEMVAGASQVRGLYAR